MGFASLSFVQFPVYRSANAVAIGIAVLLVEIMALTPLLMAVLGLKLFWPSKHAAGHKESRFWERMTSVSVKHPVWSLLITAVVLAPVIIFNGQQLSFDSLKDLQAGDPSIKGFNIVSDKFGAGKAMPTTVVIQNREAMDNNEALAVIDNLTEKLKNLKGDKEVSGPTQPKGERIEELYTNSQTKTVVSGLSAANGGVGQIKDGLDKMKDGLSTPDFSQVKDLSTGTGKIGTGITAVTDGLKKINDGIDQGAGGADKLASGIAQLKDGVSGINAGLQTISGNLAAINDGYNTLGQGYKALPGSVEQLKQLTAMMQGTAAKIDGKLPNDPDVAALKGMLDNLSAALDNLTAGINQANSNYDTLTAGLAQLNGGLKTIIDNTSPQSQLVTGINELEKGAAALSAGLKQGSAGQKQVIDSLAALSAGAQKIKAGQDSLYTGLNSLGSGMAQLKDGIGKSSDGLNSIADGINKSGDFLTQLTSTKSFYIPKEAFGTDDINKMLDAYMSKDRKTLKLTVVMESEPYSDNSIKLISDINTLVGNELKGTKLADADFGISGATSTANDLRNVATHDITFTQIIVLASIFILLIVVIRSFWIPVFIAASLMVAYYTSLSATAFISKQLFSSAKEGLSWNVPFFSFVMIAALGVDYSIFFMRRYKEYPELSAREAIVIAARKIGGVVMSAAIILAGTFATLYPSNLIVLMELAICVVIGLFLLSVVLLPAAIPALMSVSEKVSAKSQTEIFETAVNQD
ncbi:MAG: MMPL family transporter, partial [Bacillota bacterium]|nr:MMPL family transporter [Bacillota bacterium]